MSKILLYMPAILATFFSIQEIPYGEEHIGTATYYQANGNGNCMFDALPEPQYVAALNTSDYNNPVINGQSYDNATMCGAYALVTGRKGSITVKIVDRCDGGRCTENHLDLSTEAFAEIDDLSAGYIPISWQLVSVPLDGPIQFRYKDGSSQWWTGIQVRNHRNAVASVELLRDSTWEALPRAQYNYFVADNGFGSGCPTLRVTDVFGNQLIETATVCLDAGTVQQIDWTGVGQFPRP